MQKSRTSPGNENPLSKSAERWSKPQSPPHRTEAGMSWPTRDLRQREREGDRERQIGRRREKEINEIK